MADDYTLAATAGAFDLNSNAPGFGQFFVPGNGTGMYHQDAAGAFIVTSGANTVKIVLDVLEGADAVRHIHSGWTVSRVAVITGLNAAHADSTGALYKEALDALVLVTGSFGSACPDVIAATYLEEFAPELLSVECTKIRIRYKGYPPMTFELDGSLSHIETYTKLNGVPITVVYTYPEDYKYGDSLRGTTQTQGCRAPRPVPEPTFTAHWLVVAGGGGSATDMMTTYSKLTGTVNPATYTIGTIVGTKHQWCVTRVHGVSKDGGNTYEASMTLQWRKLTWDVPVTFVDPQTGQVPPDLIKDSGYKLVELSEEATPPSFAVGM